MAPEEQSGPDDPGGSSGTTTSDAPCRLWVYLAQSARVWVVLRRGPSDWFRLSLWHTDTDTFEHGQWVRGRAYERRSDLSPDGRLFVCFAGKPGRGAQLVGAGQRAGGGHMDCGAPATVVHGAGAVARGRHVLHGQVLRG